VLLIVADRALFRGFFRAGNDVLIRIGSIRNAAEICQSVISAKRFAGTRGTAFMQLAIEVGNHRHQQIRRMLAKIFQQPHRPVQDG
jgi:hypothetical protein